MSTHRLVRELRLGEDAACQGRRCRRTVPAGEPLHQVVNERRFMADPNGLTSWAYLCSACCARLGDRLEVVPPRVRPPRPRPARTADSW